MKNYYYLYWSQLIHSYRKNFPNEFGWKRKIIVFVSLLNAINIWVTLSWLQYFEIFDLQYFVIKPFNTDIANSLLNYLILTLIPILIANYLLIFRNDKYISIVKKHKKYGNRLAIIYSYGTILLGFITLMILLTI